MPSTASRVPSGQTTTLGVCNLCEAICGLELTIERRPEGTGSTGDPGQRRRTRSRAATSAPRASRSPTSTPTPTGCAGPVQDGSASEWVEIGWDEALDLVADGLARAVNEHGRTPSGIYLGNPNAHSLGRADPRRRASSRRFRTRNRFSASSVDQIPHQFVAWQLFGHQLLLPIPDIDRTSYFLVFGANPMASNGSLMTVPDFPNRLRELKARGGRMVVFDPRRTETAKVADEHHFVRPGTDAVVLLAMVHVLFEEGLTDPPAYVDDVDAVRELVADFTPEHAERVSGVAAPTTIRRITREFAAADGAAAYGRIGLSTQGFGSICQWAIQLPQHPDRQLRPRGRGAVPRAGRSTSSAARLVGPRPLRRLAQPGARRSRSSAASCPVSVLREEIETPGEGQIRAVLTIAGNPVLSTPDGKRLGEAFDAPGLHGRRRHLPQRDHPARRRDPAADHGARARPLRPRLPRARGAQHRPVHARRCSPKPEDALHDWEIFRELALRIAGPARRASRRSRARLARRGCGCR